MIALKILLLLLSSVLNSVNAVVRPSASLYLMNGEGFVAYLEVPKSFGAIQNCWFRFRDDDKIKIDLNATDPIITARDEAVLPFASTICGIRVNKLSSASAATWTLEAENVYGDFEQDHLTIQILPAQKTRFDTRVQREIGTGTIACSKHESYTKHCKITDKTGKAWDQCELFTTIRPNETFDCRIYNWGRLAESTEHIIVDIKNSSVLTTANVEENSTNIVLRCQFEDKLHSCQAELPDHKQELYIMDGLYNGRYSAYDTLISKSKCALEIPKPLESYEIGLWRIINYDSSTPSGCLFYIGKSMEEIIEMELEAADDIKVMKVYQPEGTTDRTISEMHCMVPFVVDDCFLRDPNNTVYFPDTVQFQRNRLIGKCQFTNVDVVAGIWRCGARGRDYAKDVLQDIEVIVKPKGGEVLTELVKAKRGDTVELMCKSAFEDPLSHCVFIDPQNRVYLVGTARSVKAAGRVQYFGRGIQNGECGIKISPVNTNDFGQWKCQFVRFGKQESSFTLQLSESAIAHATSVGLSVGITVIVVLVMGVVIGTIFYRRRNLSAQHSFPSTDPLNDLTTATTNSTMQAQLEL